MDQAGAIAQLERLLPVLPEFDREAVKARIWWLENARPEQLMPDDCDIWLFLAGRGSGKTMASSRAASWLALSNPGIRIAIIAPTFADIRDTCIEGASGLLSQQNPAIPDACLDVYNRAYAEVVLKNGSRFKGFSADSPERLRGPQHHALWFEEMAACGSDAQIASAWDQARFGLRLGERPVTIISTTPKPRRLLFELSKEHQAQKLGETTKLTEALGRVVVTRGSTYDNRKNLAKTYIAGLSKYEGTELGKQEIHAQLLDPSDSAILKRKWWRRWTEWDLPEVENVVLSFDTAFKARKKSDYTAFTAWGVFRIPRVIEEEHPYLEGVRVKRTRHEYAAIMLDAWKRKLPYPDLRAAAQQEHDKWADAMEGQGREPPLCLVEDKGSGISLSQEFDRAGVRVYPWNPGNDSKVLRAHLVSDILCNGKVWVPTKKNRAIGERIPDVLPDWTEEVVEECEGFTGQESGTAKPGEAQADEYHDDHVDSVTQALAYLRDNGYLGKDSDREYSERDPDDDGDDGRESEKREPIYA